MEQKTYHFAGIYQGRPKDFAVTVPFENGIVYTNEFCPRDILWALKGLPKGMPVYNSEDESQFIEDCQKQIIGMGAARRRIPILDIHIAGLMAAVMDNLCRSETIEFGRLLIYIDCFSLLLEAAGCPYFDIMEMYPGILQSLINISPDKIVGKPEFCSQ